MSLRFCLLPAFCIENADWMYVLLQDANILIQDFRRQVESGIGNEVHIYVHMYVHICRSTATFGVYFGVLL